GHTGRLGAALASRPCGGWGCGGSGGLCGRLRLALALRPCLTAGGLFGIAVAGVGGLVGEGVDAFAEPLERPAGVSVDREQGGDAGFGVCRGESSRVPASASSTAAPIGDDGGTATVKITPSSPERASSRR